jgi:NADH-quinone oxidoreductase subunit L
MEVAVVLLPLLGAIIAGLFGRLIGDRASQVVTCSLMVLAGLLSISVFVDVALGGNVRVIELFTWVDSGEFEVSWAVRADTLSAVMMLVVSNISALIHIYSIGYMSHDKSIPRFFAYLSLFTFFMLSLVTADNFLQMFFGWEGVGLCSYLLIGFWYERPSACAAAIKAFLVNRVGDIGFALGIMGCFVLFGSVGFDQVFASVPEYADYTFNFLGIEGHALTVFAILLFIGAMGKSAQLGLHTWLPDAMEGPTPVSALIHAATMVTAGVFMVCRLSPIFEYAPIALQMVTYVGAATAFFAATIGLTQFDIKRVIAYSTCSQLGYMFFAAGVSAYGAAIFHLMTHAFFKALLFLGSGSVIHAMSDEQDMRKMGGIWRLIPITYAVMWIGSLALAGIGIPGVFGFAGFYSKDIVLEAAYGAHSAAGSFAFWLGIAAAFMTAFYSWRLLFMTFHGAPRADKRVMDHVHESPWIMLVPLLLLSVGAIFAGAFAYDWFVGAVLGRLALRAAGQRQHRGGAPRADLGQVPAAGDGRRRHRARLADVRRGAGPAGRHGAGLPADPRPVLQQVVFRRALRLGFRAVGAGARPGVLEDRRRRGDRRDRPGRHRRDHPQPRPPGRAAAERLRLPLRLRHADRGGDPDHLVHVGGPGLSVRR